MGLCLGPKNLGLNFVCVIVECLWVLSLCNCWKNWVKFWVWVSKFCLCNCGHAFVFVAYDFCWPGFSPCSNLGWWGGLRFGQGGFLTERVRCAGLMVLWEFCSNLGESCVCRWYAWGIELGLLEFVGILFMIVLIKFTNLNLFFLLDNLVYVYMWIDFVLYDVHLWFFWVWFSCVLDEEDVRFECTCGWFLILF